MPPTEFNVIWAESWPDGGQPEGALRDLGAGDAGELPALVRRGYYSASRGGWGPGDVFVTDGEGLRVVRWRELAAN